MKAIHTSEGSKIVLSLDEAKTIHSCMSIVTLALDDWEYEIKVGVPAEEVVRIMTLLKGIISDSGAWGIP